MNGTATINPLLSTVRERRGRETIRLHRAGSNSCVAMPLAFVRFKISLCVRRATLECNLIVRPLRPRPLLHGPHHRARRSRLFWRERNVTIRDQTVMRHGAFMVPFTRRSSYIVARAVQSGSDGCHVHSVILRHGFICWYRQCRQISTTLHVCRTPELA